MRHVSVLPRSLPMRFCPKLKSCLALAVLAILLVSRPGSPAGSEPASPASVQKLKTFLGTYCVSCHGPDVKKGGLDLEGLAADFSQPAAFDRWVKVHDRIRTGEMPPRERKRRPTAAESEAIVKLLNTE